VEYRLSVDFEAVLFLDSLSVLRHAQMMQWLERLRSAPFSQGHVTVKGDVDRDIQVVRVAGLRVFFWSDHAVKTVEVVKIERDE
jgi:mRNA-degrading endonuclease RelE of RelBE toxin-antitoxin system